MSYRIIQHPLVESDLLDITDLIASYAGLGIGKTKVDEIVRFIAQLGDFPSIGTIRDPATNVRAIPAAEKAVVCFTVDEENRTVMILCIGYAGSNWSSRIKERLAL